MIWVCVYQGKSMISQYIRFRDWTDDTHISCVRAESMDEWEAYPGGVQKVKFGANHTDKTPVDFFDIKLTDGEEEALIAYLNSQLGKGYDYRGLIGMALRLPIQDKKELFCSEYAFGGFLKIKKPLLARIEAYKVPPAYFRLSPLLTFNFRRYTSRQSVLASSEIGNPQSEIGDSFREAYA